VCDVTRTCEVGSDFVRAPRELVLTLINHEGMGMIRIDRVITKGGDGGETSLGDGRRVPKDDKRVEAYGTVDEANAFIGQLRLHCTAALLEQIQQDLFDVGADLCVPGEAGAKLRIGDAGAARLEAEVAVLNASLAPLTSFVLPAGPPAVVAAHLARTVVRRAERRVVRLAGVEPVNPAVVRYLNRLSDYLFVLARSLSESETLWRR
jgi:cob(I)alamin adenosyltransferase